MIFLDNIVVKLKLMIYNVVFLIMNNTVLVELKIERRTSLPYFRVKLSCVFIMFAYRPSDPM